MTAYGKGDVVDCYDCKARVTHDGEIWRGHVKGCTRSQELFYDSVLGLGVKHDDAKPDWTLLPLKTLEPVLRVLAHGAKKYAPDNWKHVKPPSRYFAAAIRHLADHQAGVKGDVETGESHLAHAIACLVFLLWHEENET